MNARHRDLRRDDDPGEISYGDFPDADPYAWLDDDEDAIELDALDDAGTELEIEAATEDEALREELVAAIAGLEDEADAPPAAPAPATEPATAPEPTGELPAAELAPEVLPAAELDTATVEPPEIVPAQVPLLDLESPAEQVEVQPEAEGETAALPDMIYRVVLALPVELVEQIAALRAEASVEDMPPPGIELTPPFRAAEPGAVEALLDEWAQDNLPFEPEITGIIADVIGTQQYVAALGLEPAGELTGAHEDLMDVLGPEIVPASDAEPVSPSRLVIGSRVPAKAYPRLIANLQREIDPVGWQAETLMLIRREAGIESDDWQVVALFA